MRKYLFLLKYESRTILRDPINLFMTVFPLLMLGLSSFVFPQALQSMGLLQALTMKTALLIAIVMLLTMGSFFVGGMATFLLLDHKDEHTLHTIAATPIGLSGYLKFKLTYIYLLTVLSCLIVLLGTKWLAGAAYKIGNAGLFDKLGFWHVITFSLSSSLFAPALALTQAAFAKNKVEGFAWIKGAGIIALVPVLLLLPAFSGGLQYALGVFPNFWAAKGILQVLYPLDSPANASYGVYLAAGTAYNLLILHASFRFFLKKQQY